MFKRFLRLMLLLVYLVVAIVFTIYAAGAIALAFPGLMVIQGIHYVIYGNLLKWAHLDPYEVVTVFGIIWEDGIHWVLFSNGEE